MCALRAGLTVAPAPGVAPVPALPFLCSLISGTGLLPGPMAALLGPVAALPGPTLLPGGAAAPLGGLPLGVVAALPGAVVFAPGVVAAGPTLPPGVAAALPGVVAALIVWPCGAIAATGLPGCAAIMPAPLNCAACVVAATVGWP